jgi:2'-5' RNA ligase
MRLFAAILPPTAASEELARSVDRLRALPGADELRWTGQAGWHCTLAFLGEVDDQLLPELTGRLEQAAERTEPFPLRIDGGGTFGGRALWAGVAGGVDELGLLAERVDAAARRSGVPMEGRRSYVPHLTLAHSGGTTELGAYAQALDGFEGTPWEVAELTLVRSNLPVGAAPGEQPRYEPVVRCPLGGRGHGHPADSSPGTGR